MATVEDVFSALRAADAAGNVDDARRLTEYLIGLGYGGSQVSKPKAKEESEFVSRAKQAAASGIQQIPESISGIGLGIKSALGMNESAGKQMAQIKQEEAEQAKQRPALSFEELQKIYQEKGLVEALKNAPAYVTEQLLQSAPSMATPLAAGAAGTALTGPLGGLAAGIGTYGLQQYGQFMRRQAGEAQTPEQLAPGKAAAAAALTAPLGYIADRFTLGIGNIPKKVLGEELAAELARRTGGSLAARVGKGATMGVIAEAPTEVLEQAAERWQAGLPLDNADAKREYLEAAAGAAVIGGIGGGAYGALRGPPPEKLSPLTGEIPTQLETSVQSVMPDLTPAQSRSGLTMDQASDLRQEAAMAEQERQAALQQRQLADQQAQQEQVAQAQERARAMPGMTGAPDANAVMMERVRENEIAQQKAQEQDKKNKIKEVMNTTFYADPIMNKVAKDKALTELGQTVEPLVKPKRDAALEWASMSPEEQQEALLSAEPPVKKSQLQDPKNEPRRVKDFSKSELIQMGVEVPEEVAKEKPQYKAAEHPLNMGVDNKLIAQGARPYTYKIQAQEAAKKQPDMKVVKSGLGYVLSPKTAGELEAQKKSTIGNFQTGTPNLPYSAHEFIVSRGGLKPSHRSDMGFQDENPIVGNRYLFSGRGVSLDEAGIQLEQAGYLPKNQLHTENDVINLLTGSIKDPQYSSEGLEYISQMEQARAAKDYDLAEAKETLYAPMEDEFDYYYENDIYRLDIPDLVNMADKLDVDVEGIVMEVVRQFPNSSQEETTSAVHDSLSAAIKEKIGSRQETLESTNNKEQSFRPDPNQLKVQNELAGKSFMQASEWLIKNAPNNFSKFVAQKNHAMLKTLEAKGVILNFEVQTGQKRSLMMRNAEGVTNFTWGREGTTIKVILNGAPVTENQLGYPPGVDYDTVQHEFLHAGIRTSTKFLPLDHPVIMDLRNLFNTVVKQYNLDVKADKLPPVLMRYYKNINNVLATPDELISWGMTDKEFQKYLSTIKVGEKTVMQKIVQLVRQLLGINVTYDTALDKLVRTTDALMDIDTQVLANNMRSSNVTLGSPKMIKPLGSQQSLFSKAATRLMTDTLESRRQGFYFDAKTSPLYQTRTAEDVSFPTAAEARAAIAGNKIATNIMRERDNVKDGDYVGVRQDLNIKAAPLLSIHEGKEALHIKGAGFFTGEVQSYAPYVTLKSVFFKIRQSAREKIAQKIEQKSKMGSADGRFVKADKPNFDGVELRFNPMREHLFVDALGRAVKYADEVTLVAKRAFARGNIEYYGEEDVPARAGAAPSAAKLMELGEQITPTPDEPSGRISQNQQESLFSRNAGFFFDAKASPLYQKRTKQDVNYVDMDEAQAAVNSTEKGRRINEKNVTLKPGDYVGIRLDIPISSSTGVPVQAVHEGKASTHENGAGFYNGDVVKYLPYITLKNAYFKINQAYRAKIAAGIKKKPMGSADGIFDRIDNPNFDGVEFRFNPKREHLFVDVMGRAIKYADEITVVGNSTFARGNIEYYDASELPEAIGGFSTRAKAMEEDGQITPIPDEPKGKVSIGQQESLFSQNGYKQSMADIGAKVKGKAQQVLQNRAPADMTVFNGMSPDTIQNVNGLFFAPNKTVIDRLDDLKGNFWNTVAQKTVDQFRSIRDVSREGYMQARLSTSIDGALEGLLFYGHVFNDGGALNVRTEKNGQKLKGMIESMKPLGKDVDRFQTWMAVSREANLPADKRSTDPRMQALVNSRDEFTSGTVNGKPRMEVYEQVRKDLMALNRSVLTVAKDAGLIDKFAYDRFMADGFYIPFYKAMEDGKIESIRAASRITNQQFSKELSNKGEKPFGDLMENTLRNWSHILSASMKNQAAVTIVRDASGIGAVQPSLKVGLEWRDGKVYSVQSGDVVGNGDLVQKIVDKNGQQREVSLTESGKGTVSVQIDGLATHWHVIDPMLLESIGAITYLGPQSKIIDMMRGFKNVLRAGVTISPGFKVANLIKDSIQSIGVAGGAGEKGGLGFNAVNNILKGWASSKPGSPVYISALAGGGIFNYGSTLEGDRSKVIKKLIKQGVNSENIWDSEEKIKTGLSRLWKSYEDLGNRTESVNRALLYKNLVAQNYSHLEASFHARDLLDFSMQGSSSAVRFLSQVVPFANARLQGLYKLGRDGIIPTARVFYNSLTGKDSNLTDKQKAKAFSAVAMTTAMASMLLYLTFKDDEEFKKREQWDRDLFWWFKLPGMDFAIRIPKPFEFGAIATLAERSLEQMIDDTVESKRFTDSLSRTLFQTFSMNPMPQMFKPLYDVSTNKDAFTSAPIETAGMERLSKQERKTDMTSPLAKALGGLSHILTPESLKESEISPVQADYLIRSYFGWLGGTIETASQYAVMPFNNGVYPDADWTKRMSLGFVAKLPTQQSTYVTDFYQNNQLISQAYADMRHYAELGQAEKVQEILTEKGDLIGLEKLYDKTSKNLANIRKQVLMIQNPENISMTGEQKKEEIERLKQLISMVSEQAESIRKGMKK